MAKRKRGTNYKSASKSANARGSKTTAPQASKSGSNSTSTTSSNSTDEPSDKVEEAKQSNVNDPEWYSQDNRLVIDAASFPYSDPLGDPVKLAEPGKTVARDYGSSYVVKLDKYANVNSIPGILTLRTKASFGCPTSIKDPANVAAQLLYTQVRYNNSGRKNYDPADLFMYVASMADIYSFITWCQRIYAKAFIYSQRNKYLGKNLLESEGIDADNIVANLANLRYWVNVFINKVASFAVPANIAYFQRRAWIYSHIYLENPDGNIKDQLYQFSPDGFYRFATDAVPASMLEYKSLSALVGSTQITYDKLVTIGDWLLENMFGNEDLGLMSGDILKAFNGNIIGLAPLPEAPELIPVYSEYVLLQMKNATVVPLETSGTNPNAVYKVDGIDRIPGNLYQNANGDIFAKEFAQGLTGTDASVGITLGMNKVLTLPNPDPTPIDNMEITRLCASSEDFIDKSTSQTSGSTFNIVNCGSDIVTYVAATRYKLDASDGSISKVTSGMTANAIKQNSVTWQNVQDYIVFAAFKYAPLRFAFVDTVVSGAEHHATEMLTFGNVDNYTTVTHHVLGKLHEVALLSLLSVPGVAKIVN